MRAHTCSPFKGLGRCWGAGWLNSNVTNGGTHAEPLATRCGTPNDGGDGSRRGLFAQRLRALSFYSLSPQRPRRLRKPWADDVECLPLLRLPCEIRPVTALRIMRQVRPKWHDPKKNQENQPFINHASITTIIISNWSPTKSKSDNDRAWEKDEVCVWEKVLTICCLIILRRAAWTLLDSIIIIITNILIRNFQILALRILNVSGTGSTFPSPNVVINFKEMRGWPLAQVLFFLVKLCKQDPTENCMLTMTATSLILNQHVNLSIWVQTMSNYGFDKVWLRQVFRRLKMRTIIPIYPISLYESRGVI